MCDSVGKTNSIEYNSYSNYEHPYSKDIASFNYECNHEILKKKLPNFTNETEVSNTLYICSLMEIFGQDYIEWVTTDNGPFMTMWNDKVEKLSSYIEYQQHSGCSYACTMRAVQLILTEKYKN